MRSAVSPDSFQNSFTSTRNLSRSHLVLIICEVILATYNLQRSTVKTHHSWLMSHYLGQLHSLRDKDTNLTCPFLKTAAPPYQWDLIMWLLRHHDCKLGNWGHGGGSRKLHCETTLIGSTLNNTGTTLRSVKEQVQVLKKNLALLVSEAVSVWRAPEARVSTRLVIIPSVSFPFSISWLPWLIPRIRL